MLRDTCECTLASRKPAKPAVFLWPCFCEMAAYACKTDKYLHEPLEDCGHCVQAAELLLREETFNRKFAGGKPAKPALPSTTANGKGSGVAAAVDAAAAAQGVVEWMTRSSGAARRASDGGRRAGDRGSVGRSLG